MKFTEERNEWADRIGFEVPQTSEPFALTHIDGKMHVVQTDGAQCLYQVLTFTDDAHRLRFMKEHKDDIVVRRIEGNVWLAFSCCVRKLDTTDTKEAGQYLTNTFDRAAAWLRKEGTC